jgi:GNAT superfamily N-acetyltransferase
VVDFEESWEALGDLEETKTSDFLMGTRKLGVTHHSWVEALVREHFGSARVVSRGVLHDAFSLPGLAAEMQGVPAGLLLYHIHQGQCEVVVLIAARQRQGVGRLLLEAIQPLAHSSGCRRIWLITTNANPGAIAFYRAVGWQQVAIHRGGAQEARRLKPEIPELGADGMPIDDEIEFEFRLEGV